MEKKGIRLVEREWMRWVVEAYVTWKGLPNDSDMALQRGLPLTLRNTPKKYCGKLKTSDNDILNKLY